MKKRVKYRVKLMQELYVNYPRARPKGVGPKTAFIAAEGVALMKENVLMTA